MEPITSRSLPREGAGQRIIQLDGLRGIAVLMVVFFHYFSMQYEPRTNLSGLERVMNVITSKGFCGVDLFFVLSGFFIGSILLKNRGASKYFSVFYIRRFFRIIPIFYVILVIYLLLRHSHLYHPNSFLFEPAIPIGYYFVFLQNFLMGFRNYSGSGAIAPSWSLAVEEQFYLIMPLVTYFLKPRQILWFILFCLVLAPVSRLFMHTETAQYTWLISRMDTLAPGVLLAYIMQFEKARDFISRNLVAIKWGFFGLIGIILLQYALFNFFFLKFTFFGLSFAYIVLIALFSGKGLIYQFLTWKFFLNMGKLSYFIYLYHQLVNGLLHQLLLHQTTPVLEGMYSYLLTGAAFLLTWLMATLSFTYFEGPLIRYSHSFKYGD